MGGAGSAPSMIAVNNFRPDIDFAVSGRTTPYRSAPPTPLIRLPPARFVPLGGLACKSPFHLLQMITGDTALDRACQESWSSSSFSFVLERLGTVATEQVACTSVQRLHHRGKEIFVVDRVSSSWLSACAPNDHYNILSRIQVDE